MNWDSYKISYYKFQTCLGASGLISHISSATLNDFPNSLPLCLRHSVCKIMADFLASPEKDKDYKIDKQFDVYKLNSEDKIKSQLIKNCLCLAIGELGMNQSLKWEQYIINQHLIMIFSHLEAFFSESVRSICECRPEVLRRNKQITWNEVMKHNDLDGIRRYLIEQFIYELFWKDISEKIEFLKSEFSLSMEFSKEKLEVLKNGELVRHLLVHCDGKITPDFLKKIGPTVSQELEIGEYINVDTDFLVNIFDLALLLGSELFFSISKKYFGVDPKNTGEMNWTDSSESSRPHSGAAYPHRYLYNKEAT